MNYQGVFDRLAVVKASEDQGALEALADELKQLHGFCRPVILSHDGKSAAKSAKIVAGYFGIEEKRISSHRSLQVIADDKSFPTFGGYYEPTITGFFRDLNRRRFSYKTTGVIVVIEDGSWREVVDFLWTAIPGEKNIEGDVYTVLPDVATQAQVAA